MEQVWKCPLCESYYEKHQFFARVVSNYDRGPLQVTYAICQDCGHIFLWERHSDAENENYYRHGKYRQVVQGTPEVTERVLDEQTRRSENLLPMIDHEPEYVLDIGASTGLWLDVLRERFDCKVKGVDPSEHFRLYARDNLDIEIFSELGILYSPEYFNAFDMITCIHTLEHMNDPVSFLVSLHEFITEDGCLYIEVPNVFQEHSLTISHPQAFSPTTLDRALNKSGWEVEWMQLYHGIRKQRTLAPYILAKAVPGGVDDFIAKPDIPEIRKLYREGMEQIAKDREEWEKSRM